MKNKKLTGSVLVAVITLVTLVIGATYAYFTVATTNSFGTRTATATAESVGTVAITAGSDLSLTVTRAQMSKTNKGKIYYATGDNISSGTLGTVKVTGEGMYSCDYTMSITLSGTMLSSINEVRNTILYVNDIPYDIYTYKDAGTITLNGTINGLVQETPQRIKGNIAVFNTKKDQSSELAGKAISASIKVTNITCTAGDDLLASKIVQLSGQTVGDGTVINVNEDEYRYSGSNPNNYITFNNETWRIIGIVDGYVKIIRNDSLGKFAMDLAYDGEWTGTQLMMMLNPSEYLKEGYTISNNMVYEPNGNLIYQNMGSYYNKTNGYKPEFVDEGVTDYPASAAVDFSSTGLNATARNLVQENVWYTASPLAGEEDWEDWDELAHILVDKMHKNERSGQQPDVNGDGKTISGRGKVGLMYLSDYYYANNNYYNDADYPLYYAEGACSDNWLCIAKDEFTINAQYSVDRYGCTDINYGPVDTFDIRPAVYLKSGIKVTGTGDINSKYQIVN